MSKRRGQEYWQGHAAAWLEGGPTQRAHCKGHGLSMATFHRWRRSERLKKSTGFFAIIRIITQKQ
jgi:hypothetical protein